MTGKRYVEMCEDGDVIVQKAKTLALGEWDEDNIYLLDWSRGDFAISRYRKEVDPKLADGVWQDHFEAFITGADHVMKAFDFLNVGIVAPENFYAKVKDGERLLYADEGQLDRYYEQYSEFLHAASDIPEEYRVHEVDPTPGADHTGVPEFPTHTDHRVNMDGQNIVREGDVSYDPAAERGFPPEYYKLAQEDLGERDQYKEKHGEGTIKKALDS